MERKKTPKVKPLTILFQEIIKRIEKIYESKYNETVNYKIMENIYDTLGAEKHKA